MDIPIYVSAIFIVTTVLTVALFYRVCKMVSSSVANKILMGLMAWMVLQGVVSASGFYLKTDALPPRFALTVIPVFISIIYFLTAKRGQNFLDKLPLKDLTTLHVCRVPVEIVLLWLYQSQQIPQSMTFEGRNFDILSGLTAVPMAWLAFQNGEIKRIPLFIWNIICLALVLNIVTIGMLSAPTPLQQWAFEQPNVGVLKFPFVWLPSVIVPIVILSHLVAIRRLLLKRDTPQYKS